jgi:uncharacterized protein
MSESGTIAWVDLTVPDPDPVREFYARVAGWKPEPVDMGGYSDFNMVPAGGTSPVAGLCHAQGPNAGLPAQWLIYIVVDDLDASLARCRELGGAVVRGPKDTGGESRYCVIRDPAGAVVALYQK